MELRSPALAQEFYLEKEVDASAMEIGGWIKNEIPLAPFVKLLFSQ